MLNSILTFLSNKKEIIKERYFKRYTYKDFMDFMDSVIVANELDPIDRLVIVTGNIEKIECIKSPHIKINENGRYEFESKFYFLSGDLKVFFVIRKAVLEHQIVSIYVNDNIKNTLNKELKELIAPHFFNYSKYFKSDFHIKIFEDYKSYILFVKKLMTLIVKLESEKRLLINTEENV